MFLFQVKYDLLVSNAIKFLTSVVERPQYAQLFSNDETLQNICEKVLVPNMKLRGNKATSHSLINQPFF